MCIKIESRTFWRFCLLCLSPGLLLRVMIIMTVVVTEKITYIVQSYQTRFVPCPYLNNCERFEGPEPDVLLMPFF